MNLWARAKRAAAVLWRGTVSEATAEEIFGRPVPWEEYFTANGRRLLPVLSGYGPETRAEKNATVRTLQDHDLVRRRSEILAETNPNAIGLLQRVQAYHVGKGSTTEVQAVKEDAEPPKRLAAKVREHLKSFKLANCWIAREKEMVWRLHVHGEFFLRFYPQADGVTRVRFVEPSAIRPPVGEDAEGEWSFGIRTPRGEDGELGGGMDALAPTHYNIHDFRTQTDEQVEAHFIIHAKINCTSNAKRGLPSLYACEDDLAGAARLRHATRQGERNRALISYFRQHDAAGEGEVRAFRSAMATETFDRYTQTGNESTVYVEELTGPSVVDIPAGLNPLPPPGSPNVAGSSASVEQSLEAVAARFGVPVWVVSGKTDNGNFAQALVVESPFTVSITDAQADLAGWVDEAHTKAVEIGAEQGYFPEDVLEQIDLMVSFPSPVSRNKLEETNRREKLFQNNILSEETWSAEEGYDRAKQKQQILEERRDQIAPQPTRIPSVPVNPLTGQPAQPQPGTNGNGKAPSSTPGARYAQMASRLREQAEEFERLAESDFDESKHPRGQPGNAGRDADDPDDVDPETLADLFYGLYGDDALEILKRLGGLTEGWSEADHPRGKGGKFIPKGSAEAVSAATDVVDRVLGGDHDVDPKELLDHLSILTKKQIETLAKKHGKTAPKLLRAQLVDAVQQIMGQNKVTAKSKNDPNRKASDERPDEQGNPRAAAAAAPGAGGQVAGAAGGARDETADRGGPAGGQPAGDAAPRGVPAGKVALDLPEIKRRLERYDKLFRSRGNGRAADLMAKLSQHVEAVGGQAALDALGDGLAGGEDAKVGYTESNYWMDSMGDFTEAYLDRYGITPVARAPQGAKVVSPFTTEYPGLTPDFKPAETPYETKLDEAKDLPGLEATEDLSKAVGSDVTHLNPDVMAKLDEKYGKGRWIVKTYGDDAFAGQGIYFPQLAQQKAADARDAIWRSGGELAKYGFSHLRDDSGRVVGIRHAGGDEYRFGTPKYEQTIQGDARAAADQAAAAAPHEQGMELPNGGKQFMVQPAFPVVGVSEQERAAGRTIAPGEGRVHVVVRNGKAEVIPHSTWLKGDGLPVVFESDDTRAMAKAAQEAIDALPEKARQGQLYAPDVVKTADGYKVVELNAAVDQGGSGYLWDNPFIIDAYVSHLSGRDPGHVQFVRKLFTGKARKAAAN